MFTFTIMVMHLGISIHYDIDIVKSGGPAEANYPTVNFLNILEFDLG